MMTEMGFSEGTWDLIVMLRRRRKKNERNELGRLKRIFNVKRPNGLPKSRLERFLKSFLEIEYRNY